MTLVKNLEYRQIDGDRPHRERKCTYSLFTVNGQRFLQINTYTSEREKHLGHSNQMLRFGKEGIKELRRVLREYDAIDSC